MWKTLGALGALVLSGCSSPANESAAPRPVDGECPLGYAAEGEACVALQGDVVAHDFDSWQLESGEEIDGLCQSWTLGNDTELWVNAIEVENDGAYHHSNWLFAPDDLFDGPDGFWKCADRDYSEVGATIAGGVLYAQGTQDTKDLQLFPQGVAIRIPPHSRIIGGTHLLNPTPKPVATHMTMRLWTIPTAEVSVPLAPFRLNYGDLELPPASSSDFSADCRFPWPQAETAASELYYAMPHYHYLGTRFELQLSGGERDGERVFEDFGENTGQSLQGLSLAGAEGLRFTCGYDNPTDKVIHFGIGDQEMCVMLGFVRSGWTFDANVAAGDFVETTGGVHHYSGECRVIGTPFSQTK